MHKKHPHDLGYALKILFFGSKWIKHQVLLQMLADGMTIT